MPDARTRPLGDRRERVVVAGGDARDVRRVVGVLRVERRVRVLPRRLAAARTPCATITFGVVYWRVPLREAGGIREAGRREEDVALVEPVVDDPDLHALARGRERRAPHGRRADQLRRPVEQRVVRDARPDGGAGDPARARASCGARDDDGHPVQRRRRSASATRAAGMRAWIVAWSVRCADASVRRYETLAGARTSRRWCAVVARGERRGRAAIACGERRLRERHDDLDEPRARGAGGPARRACAGGGKQRRATPGRLRRNRAKRRRIDTVHAPAARRAPGYTVPPRGCGGIGRRARFRSVWAKARGGSSPLIRMTGSVRGLPFLG